MSELARINCVAFICTCATPVPVTEKVTVNKSWSTCAPPDTRELVACARSALWGEAEIYPSVVLDTTGAGEYNVESDMVMLCRAIFPLTTVMPTAKLPIGVSAWPYTGTLNVSPTYRSLVGNTASMLL